MTGWEPLVEQLVRERGARLTAYAALLVGRDGDASDLVHDALVKVFSKRRMLHGVGEAESYVRATMATIVIDRARSASSGRRAAQRAFVPDEPRADLDAGLDVRAALRQLPPRVQVCVVLRYFDDLTISQISERLNIADGTVKRYLHDANAALAPLLDITEDWDESPETADVVPASERNR